jgi:hypothetical protein
MVRLNRLLELIVVQNTDVYRTILTKYGLIAVTFGLVVSEEDLDIVLKLYVVEPLLLVDLVDRHEAPVGYDSHGDISNLDNMET